MRDFSVLYFKTSTSWALDQVQGNKDQKMPWREEGRTPGGKCSLQVSEGSKTGRSS